MNNGTRFVPQHSRAAHEALTHAKPSNGGCFPVDLYRTSWRQCAQNSPLNSACRLQANGASLNSSVPAGSAPAATTCLPSLSVDTNDSSGETLFLCNRTSSFRSATAVVLPGPALLTCCCRTVWVSVLIASPAVHRARTWRCLDSARAFLSAPLLAASRRLVCV